MSSHEDAILFRFAGSVPNLDVNSLLCLADAAVRKAARDLRDGETTDLAAGVEAICNPILEAQQTLVLHVVAGDRAMTEIGGPMPVVDGIYERAAQVRELDGMGLLRLADDAVRVATECLMAAGETEVGFAAQAARHPIAECLCLIKAATSHGGAPQSYRGAPTP